MLIREVKVHIFFLIYCYCSCFEIFVSCCISITTSADRMYVEVTLSVTVSVELHVVMYISACFLNLPKMHLNTCHRSRNMPKLDEPTVQGVPL